MAMAQGIDGAMIKAPMALQEVGNNPTDRGEKQKPCSSNCVAELGDLKEKQ